MSRSKQLRIATTQVGGNPDMTRLTLEYGTGDTKGVIDVALDDLAEFMDQLRIGFEEVVIRPWSLPKPEKKQ